MSLQGGFTAWESQNRGQFPVQHQRLQYDHQLPEEVMPGPLQREQCGRNKSERRRMKSDKMSYQVFDREWKILKLKKTVYYREPVTTPIFQLPSVFHKILGPFWKSLLHCMLQVFEIQEEEITRMRVPFLCLKKRHSCCQGDDSTFKFITR